MIHPTRTDLLLLRDKVSSIRNSVSILQARRQALIREFLASVRLYLRSRQGMSSAYASAIAELALARGHEGDALIDAIAAGSARDIGVEIVDNSVMGVRFQDLTGWGPFVRTPPERGFGYANTTPHLDEAAYAFEKLTEDLIEVAKFESRLKRLGEAIRQVTRRVRVLEERLLPQMLADIRSIAQHLGERERESHFRLKKFKTSREQASREA
ncbi:MAG TPA: V-type ATP synthase subunit D [Vicinamibacterales bacterium]|jgi:V/A-type H+-transporting ATPase subunit D